MYYSNLNKAIQKAKAAYNRDHEPKYVVREVGEGFAVSSEEELDTFFDGCEVQFMIDEYGESVCH